MITNREIAELLRKVAAAYTVKEDLPVGRQDNRFKIIAYERAADSIEHATSEIKDLWDDGKLDEIPGIGASIAGHLDELFRTGKVSYFEKIMKSLPGAMFPLLSVPGFGPKKAYKLAVTIPLKNPKTVIEELEKAAKKGKIAKIPGFGAKSEKEILSSLQDFEKGRVKEIRMSLPVASGMAEDVIGYLKKSEASLKVDPLGSLRRQVSTIGDIDISVATEKPDEVINFFLSYPKKRKIIEKGPTGASLLLQNGRQVDLRVQKPRTYGSMLQYFTGSKNHNIHLRELALKQNLSLSEYGITRSAPPGGARIATSAKSGIKEYSTEESFYEALGMDWIPPEIREDSGEIEASVNHELPELVKLKDIKGDLHIHSDYPIEPSHDLGADPMEEIIKKAESLDYSYLGFSEHNPSVNNHSQEQIHEILRKRKEKIEQLKLTSKIVRVINLLEVDIQPDGKLSLTEDSLDLMDGVIASVHSRFNLPKDEMTERILKALEHPQVRILGHPTGRLLGKREGYDVDWERVFDFCASHNKALEINAWPERLDLPDSLVRRAVEKKIKMIISTDAHAAGQMDLMTYGVSVARRGWAEKNDILNTLDYNEFYKWLRVK